jgi:hypothetical protein
MRKPILLLSLLFVLCLSSKAELSIWGSAIYLNVNGTSDFYNTQKLIAPYAIGNMTFHGVLGVFGKNSGNLKIAGAEMNIGHSNMAPVCSGNLFYTIYKLGERPATPIFSNFTLSMYCNCSGSSFSSCGGKACNNVSDQKLQNVSQSIDLTTFETGDYTIEIFYQANAGTNCSQQVMDNRANDNYKADFVITAPLAINMILLNGIATDRDIKIKWVVQNDVEINKYEVQKSETGLNFTSIEAVTSFHSSTNSTYLYSDANPVLGTNYYRIKSYNINGSVNLSRVFRIYYGKVGNTIFIYPNPSGSQLTLRLAAVKKGNYKMSVFSTSGQIITSMPIDHDGLDKTLRIDLPVTLSHGIYRLFLIDRYQFYKQSFLVK